MLKNPRRKLERRRSICAATVNWSFRKPWQDDDDDGSSVARNHTFI